MNTIFSFFSEYILHFDDKLVLLVDQFGPWVYVLLFLVVFFETGVVVTPFLPGDTLLFAAGALAAVGSLHIAVLFVILFCAAVLGDSVNYWIGQKLGLQVFDRPNSRWFKKEHLERTHRFYEKYGPSTIVIARFVPIVRTIAPFVAGVGQMRYKQFLTYNIVGAFIWVTLFLFAGYFFGQLTFVQDNFSYIVFAIIVLSLLPPLIEVMRHRKQKNALSDDNLTSRE